MNLLFMFRCSNTTKLWKVLEMTDICYIKVSFRRIEKWIKVDKTVADFFIKVSSMNLFSIVHQKTVYKVKITIDKPKDEVYTVNHLLDIVDFNQLSFLNDEDWESLCKIYDVYGDDISKGRMEHANLMRGIQSVCKQNGMTFCPVGSTVSLTNKDGNLETKVHPRPLSICQWCKKDNARNTCSRCRITKYCDKQCQQNDWKMHKILCIER